MNLGGPDTERAGEDALDPHAFLYWLATGLVVTPIQSWTGAVSGNALVLKITETGLTTVGLISHQVLSRILRPTCTPGMERSMGIGNSIWTLSGRV